MTRKIRCPYCGAEFKAPEGFNYVVCPYCGTVIVVERGERTEAWIYPVRLEEHDAYYAAISKALQLPGAPKDLAEKAQYHSGELHYIPLHICRGWAIVKGCRGAEVSRETVEAATDAPWLPNWYRFPAVGRTAFNPEEAERGVFHQVARDATRTCRRLEQLVAIEALARASQIGCNGRVESRSEYIGIAHYPFWLIRYRYQADNRTYMAAIDAVDATVAYLEYPMPLTRRLQLLKLAGTTIAAGIVGASLVALVTHNWETLAGLASSLAAVTPFLQKAVGRLGRYTPRKPKVVRAVLREA